VTRQLAALALVALTCATALRGEQAAVSPAPQAASQQEQRGAFRAGIDVVSLNVTVADNTGRYVTDLEESEFMVFENGVKQDISFFSRTQRPIALSMLLDSSASMENKLPILQTAATTFVRRLRPEDMAQIIDFDSSVTIRQQFTASHGDLERGIQQMVAGGPTALHNAISVGLVELRKVRVAADEEPRRQALIVFSDGQDTSSLLTFDDVLDRAKRSETAIYTIGLRDAVDHEKGFRQAEFVLRQLAMETGGRAFFPNNVSDLVGVYEQIAEELSHQYAIGYTSKNARRDGAWRPIVVQVTRPNATARTRKGYFGPR
jgi:Ca-activated chloride channel family protein